MHFLSQELNSWAKPQKLFFSEMLVSPLSETAPQAIEIVSKCHPDILYQGNALPAMENISE
jgi:hypothetical protein